MPLIRALADASDMCACLAPRVMLHVSTTWTNSRKSVKSNRIDTPSAQPHASGFAEGWLSIFRIVACGELDHHGWCRTKGYSDRTAFHPIPDGPRHMPQFATSEAELEAIHGLRDTAVATIKEIDHISDHYRMFIDASPLVLVATAGPEGLDCSPRGDAAGFVRIVNRHRVMLPCDQPCSNLPMIV